MTTDALFEALRREVARTLNRRVTARVLRYVDKLSYASEVLEDHDLARALRRITAREGQRLTKLEQDDLAQARERLVSSKKFGELVASVEELLDTRDGREDGEPRSQGRRPTPAPYVAKMTMAIVEPLDGETYDVLSAEAPAIIGEFRDGLISIEAEAWVPTTALVAYYRAMQRSVGAPPRQAAREESLDLFLWVRAHRAVATDKRWDETRAAWNRTHKRRLYRDTSNFHRDYHRAARLVEITRARAHKLRERALDIEFAEGSDPRS